MPELVIKSEGRNTGVKTVITNCEDIAIALHRSPVEICKYIGYTVGTQIKHNSKDDRVVINGAFTKSTIGGILGAYIEEFVLCPNCSLPETRYKFKHNTLSHSCDACGTVALINANNKLTKFILKSRALMKKHVSKKHKDKKSHKKEHKSTNADNGVDDDNDIIWYTDLSEEAVASRAKEGNIVQI